jgi:hypothetical protein
MMQVEQNIFRVMGIEAEIIDSLRDVLPRFDEDCLVSENPTNLQAASDVVAEAACGSAIGTATYCADADRALNRLNALALLLSARTVIHNYEPATLVLALHLKHKTKASESRRRQENLMYPVLDLLRSACLPAASTLESAIGVVLVAAHSNIAWIKRAEVICQKSDAALARPLVDGVIAYARAMRASSCQGSKRFGNLHPTSFPSESTASESTTCPLWDLMHPILEKLRSASLPMADKLQATLRVELETAVVESMPDVPDFSMRTEAEIVAVWHSGLRDFLLSPACICSKTYVLKRASRRK